MKPCLIVVVVIAFCLVLPVSVAPADAPLNVVLIISDDQGWGDYGFMGHPVIQTPNIDRLAYASLVYPRGYVPSSLCRPSLATVITGLYPFQHKIVGNDPAPPEGFAKEGERYLALCQIMTQHIEHVPTLPGMLAEKGYTSFQTGKWWQGSYKRGGFTFGMTHGDPAKGGRHGDEGLTIGREGMQPIFDFIDNAGEQPFFLWYAPFVPHTPHNPPERLLEKYIDKTDSPHIARYWAMCEWFDETCGELLDYLDEKNLAENTLIAYFCDNGWIQSVDSHRYAQKSKRSPYDGGVRTPIMLRLPGRIKPQTVFAPASSVDLAPTILKLCGLQPTEMMTGIDLTDLAAVRARNGVFGDIYLHDVQNLSDPLVSLTFRWRVQDRWKIIVPQFDNARKSQEESVNNYRAGEVEVELFDILADPYETENLAAKYPEKVAELMGLVDAWYPVGQ